MTHSHSAISSALIAQMQCAKVTWDKSVVAQVVSELEEDARGHLLILAVKQRARPSAIRQLLRTRQSPVPPIFVRQALEIVLSNTMPRTEDVQRAGELAAHKSCTLLPSDLPLALMLLQRLPHYGTLALDTEQSSAVLNKLFPVLASNSDHPKWPELAEVVLSVKSSLAPLIPWAGIWAGPSATAIVSLVQKALGDGNSNTKPTNPWVLTVLEQCEGLMDTIVLHAVSGNKKSDLVGLASIPDQWLPFCAPESLTLLQEWISAWDVKQKPSASPDANMEAIKTALTHELLTRAVATPNQSRSALRM